MTIEQFREYCLSLPHATEDVKWGNDLTYCIGAKMFAVTGLDMGENISVTVKTTPERFAELTERDGINPAHYVARYHWITIENSNAIGDKELENLIKDSYKLVLEKLPKKLRAQFS